MSTLYNEVLDEINNGIINALVEHPIFYAEFDTSQYVESETLTKDDINQIVKVFRYRGFTASLSKDKICISWNSPQLSYLNFKAYDYNYNNYDWTKLLNTTYSAQELYVRLLDGHDFKQLTPYNLYQNILLNISYRNNKDIKEYKDARFYGINRDTIINLYADTFNDLAKKNIYVTIDNDGVLLVKWYVIDNDHEIYIKNTINI